MPGLQQVTHDQQGNAFWAGNNLYAGASASQATGAAAVTLVNLLAGAQSGDSPALVGAQALTVIVYNNGTAQTITGLSLATTGTTASGGKGSITYPISKDVNGNAVSIASGSSQTFFVPITNGILEELVLTPTFGAAPAAGTVETMTTVHTSPTAAMQMLGSSAPLPSPGQKDLVGGSSGVAPFTLATSTSYTSSTLDYLGNRKVSAFFNDAGASTSPTYTLAVNCLAVGAYGGTINSSTINTTIGYSFVGPIEIVTGSTNVVVTNSSTTNTLAVYQLSLGVQ